MKESQPRFTSVISRLSRYLNWVTVVGLVAMSLITTVDVIGAKVFRAPLLWSFDVTSLLGLVVLIFALAYTQLEHAHIEIEFLTDHLPLRLQKAISAFVSLLVMALFAVMTWQMTDYAMTLQRTGRVTTIQEIPLYPFAYAAAFCFLTIFSVVALQLINALAEVKQK